MKTGGAVIGQVFICLYILQYLQFAVTLQCLNKYFQLKKRGWSLFLQGRHSVRTGHQNIY